MGYEHKYIFGLEAQHCDADLTAQEMPNFLEWLWGDESTVIEAWQ